MSILGNIYSQYTISNNKISKLIFNDELKKLKQNLIIYKFILIKKFDKIGLGKKFLVLNNLVKNELEAEDFNTFKCYFKDGLILRHANMYTSTQNITVFSENLKHKIAAFEKLIPDKKLIYMYRQYNKDIVSLAERYRVNILVMGYVMGYELRKELSEL